MKASILEDDTWDATVQKMQNDATRQTMGWNASI
jgi:hypothetical protein